jgi:shikimate kinase
MGSGKTTIGKELSQSLSMDFIDTDKMIEQQEGRTISQLFESIGEKEFRRLETEYIKGLTNIRNTIIATGGGMPCFEDNLNQLKKAGLVIYLKSGIDTLINRISNSKSRPLIQNKSLKKTLSELLKKRRPCYSKADLTVLSSRDKMLVVTRITMLL